MELWDVAWKYSVTRLGFVANFTAEQLQVTLGDEEILTLDELLWFPWADALPAHGDYGNTDVHDLHWWQRWDGSAEGLSNIQTHISQGSAAAEVAVTPEPSTAVLAVIVGAGLVYASRRVLYA